MRLKNYFVNLTKKTKTAGVFLRLTPDFKKKAQIYAVENVVNNIDEEREFCESVNHQANLVIEIKFANGKIN